MSKYTTELRFICEFEAGYDESQGYTKINDVISKALPKIFSFDFPIFDSSYRTLLCTKIIKHYYTREIGEETYGLWKLRLETRMNEIMPYYNKLYTAWLQEFNPLYDTDLTRDHILTRESNTDGTQNGTTRVLFSDTPQGSLQNVENETYLTNATKTTTDNTYGEDYDSTDDFLEHVRGKSSGASYSKMLDEYRKSLLNIDMMVINELKDLFMNIW